MKTYIFCLKDIEHDKQRGIWSVTTALEPGEIAYKFKAIYARLSSRWAVFFWQTDKPLASVVSMQDEIKAGRSQTTNVSIMSTIKAITDVIKKLDDDTTSTVIVLPANSPWSNNE